MARDGKPSVAGRELDRLLAEHGPVWDALLANFHPSYLYNLRKGFRTPSLKTAVAIESLTEGRIRHDDWLRFRRRAA